MGGYANSICANCPSLMQTVTRYFPHYLLIVNQHTLFLPLSFSLKDALLRILRVRVGSIAIFQASLPSLRGERMHLLSSVHMYQYTHS